MADLSWAREAGLARRATLDREAHHGHAVLVDAMFDGHVNQLWRRLSVAFQETVEAYNVAGQFSDVSFLTTNEHIVAERRHDPRFMIELRLDRVVRQLLLITKDADGEPLTDRLECAFVDGDLTLWHTDQIENGYQLAKRLLKARL
jgi:hypothetical protein